MHISKKRIPAIACFGLVWGLAASSPALANSSSSHIDPTVWSEVREILISPRVRDSSMGVWLEGDILKRVLWVLTGDELLERIDGVMSHLRGIRILRGKKASVSALIYFDHGFDISLEESAKIYAVHVPEVFRLDITLKDGLIGVVHDEVAGDRLKIKARVPLVSDTIYPRRFSVDSSNGRMSIEVGILGNLVSVAAKASGRLGKFEGVALFSTLWKNFKKVGKPLGWLKKL